MSSKADKKKKGDKGDKGDKGKGKGEKDEKKSKKEGAEAKPDGNGQAETKDYRLPAGEPIDPQMLPFEAGRIFSQFDHDGDGKLNKAEFTEMVRRNPDLLRAGPINPATQRLPGTVPTEVISNRVLTHFDETSGVAIPRHEVDQHVRMGNVVTPLVDAYKQRYERLRAVLTGRLLPKREHLLQLRRHLQHLSAEVDAKRRSIERETMTDAEQIIERLRGVESMRQSSIRHQVLQLEEELQSIERLARRVERANIEEEAMAGTGSVLLTSANPASATIEPVRAPRATAMVEVIHEYGDLLSLMEHASQKQITVQTDFPTDDFPRETAERLEVIARCDKYTHAANVKGHMLFTAMQEKDRLEASLLEEKRLSQEYALEITQWAQMAQGLQQQVAEHKYERDALQRRVQHLLLVLRNHNIHYEG